MVVGKGIEGWGMVVGKGIEGWGMELGNFGGEVGEVGEREGERLSYHLFFELW